MTMKMVGKLESRTFHAGESLCGVNVKGRAKDGLADIHSSLK